MESHHTRLSGAGRGCEWNRAPKRRDVRPKIVGFSAVNIFPIFKQ